ncbi:unnamed protein product [Prorocentrum cordatum]|uniref:Uncharacterized protein n=1 Tax=Prorocentrum cordatum TaxID=2364126 RepID=A0ABN9SBJ1_9DINO|nr:unnamed protein product [Polarella glacialis]
MVKGACGLSKRMSRGSTSWARFASRNSLGRMMPANPAASSTAIRGHPHKRQRPVKALRTTSGIAMWWFPGSRATHWYPRSHAAPSSFLSSGAREATAFTASANLL